MSTLGEKSDTVGWPAEVLWLDLSKGKISRSFPDKDIAENFLGGRGFGSRMLYDITEPGANPLSPENFLMFSVGPLTGTLAPTSSRFVVTSKSPLTDIFGDSNCGGYFGPELRFAGYSQLIFGGKAKKPTYVFIDDDHVEFRDASKFWGMNTWDTQESIVEELGDPSVKVVSIGSAGENLVKYACIISGLKSAAGRCGMGAVMGSKMLKAIAVRGSKSVELGNPDIFEDECRSLVEIIRNGDNFRLWSEQGTPCLLTLTNEWGALGVRNYQSNYWKYAENVSGEKLRKEFTVKMRSCFNCPVHCRNFYVVKKGHFKGVYGEGPEFSLTQAAPLLDIRSLEPLLELNNLLNQYGIDCVSFYANMMWAIDCFQRGILSLKDTGGIELNWGDYETVLRMVPLIAHREGFGKILAEGEKRASKIVRKGSEKYIYHVKGMFPVVEDPRALKSFGAGYYTSTRGGDHLRALYWSTPKDMDIIFSGQPTSDPRVAEGKGVALKWYEDFCAAIDALGVCKFPFISIRSKPMSQLPDILAKLVQYATGFKIEGERLLKTGERIYNVEKAYNSRLGLGRQDDDFSNPEKFTKEPIPDGPAKGLIFERDYILNDYYKARGWDVKTGLQTKSKLEELKLGYIASDLSAIGRLVEE